MIIAKNLTKTFEGSSKGILDVNLQINPGEFVSIIGPSGSGKTTFLKHINGNLLSTSGAIEVLGIDPKSANENQIRQLRRQIGFIYQQFNLVKNLSVQKNVLTGRLGFHWDIAGALGLFTKAEKELALKKIAAVGLVGRENSLVDKLSGGQQQRVAIARALVQEPEIILADEPMASLDPKTSEVVLEILRDYNQKQKKTVIVNIHVLDLAKRYATRIIGLRAGRLVFDGSAKDLTDETVSKIYGDAGEI